MIDRLIGVDTIERRMSSEIMRLSWKIGSGNLDSLRRTYLSREKKMKMVENVQEDDLKEEEQEKVKEEKVKEPEKKVTIVKKKRRQPKSLLDWLQMELEKKHVSIGNLWSLMMGSTRTDSVYYENFKRGLQLCHVHVLEETYVVFEREARES